jgi:outer membrane murein-binding lipoprotein Lpp
MSKNKVLLLFVAITVLSVSVIGCVSQKEYDTLEKENETLHANLASAQREYEFLQSQMTSLQKEWEVAKAALEAETAHQSTVINEAQQNIAELQAKLDVSLNTEIKQSYAFSFQSKSFIWELSIPLKTYLYYKEKARITDTSKYSVMVNDNYADSLIDKLVKQIQDAVLRYNYNKTDTVNLIGTFIQSLIRANNETNTPYDNYPQYPIETLFNQGVDCEDTSILTAALLQRLEYNQVIFVFSEPKHVAVGVYVPAVYGLDGWEYQAKRYIYLETTGENSTLGHAPSIYLALQPEIYPVGK